MNATGNYATHEMESCCQPNSVNHAYADALQMLASHCRKIVAQTEQIPLEQAAGRTLAKNVCLDRSEPPVSRSAMDGYAVLLGDGINSRQIVAVNYAGDTGNLHLEPGHAIKVMTGASVPLNAEAVVMVEHCQVIDDQLQIDKLPSKSNIRDIGEMAQKGDVAVVAGQLLGAGEIAAIASCGVSQPTVYCRPRVAILSTGDEIVAYDGVVSNHQSRDSNRLMLAQQVAEFGGSVANSSHVADDLTQLGSYVAEALGTVDVLITIGGVSMGDKDYLPKVFADAGVQEMFHKVAMRPGKPIWVGHCQSTIVVGLPGNPVSSFVGASLFVRPIVDAFLGNFSRRTKPQQAISGCAFQSKARYDFVLADYDSNGRIFATNSSGSADWRSLSASKVLAMVPPNSIIDAGDHIEVIPV